LRCLLSILFNASFPQKLNEVFLVIFFVILRLLIDIFNIYIRGTRSRVLATVFVILFLFFSGFVLLHGVSLFLVVHHRGEACQVVDREQHVQDIGLILTFVFL
jgi:hypothetical protein